MSLSSLPSEKQIRLAIDRWWRGGGGTSRIISLLRREQATLEESVEVAKRLAEFAASGRLSVVTEDIASVQLDMVRAARARREDLSTKKAVKDLDEYDPDRCLFQDGVECPQCTRLAKRGAYPFEYGAGPQNTYGPIVHGHRLSLDEFTANVKELRSLLAAFDEEQGRELPA